METEPDYEPEESGFPIIPFPSSTVYSVTGQSESYTCTPTSIIIGELRTVSSIHYVHGSTILIQMSNIAPQHDTAAVIRNSKDPMNIIIESMTMKFRYNPSNNRSDEDESPLTNVSTSVTMLTTTALPASGKAVNEHFTLPNASSIHYMIPRLCLMKYASSPYLGFTEVAPATDDGMLRFTTIDECSRTLSRNTYSSMCTAMIYPPQCHSDYKTISDVVLIPVPELPIPVEFSVGIDQVRLFHEYSNLRQQPRNRDSADQTVLVPLFRSKDITFVPTLFGFWLRYFMDVKNGRRKHILPKKAWFYAPSIDDCKMRPTEGSMSLHTIMIEAPRLLITTLYDSLLATVADNASARLYHTQKTNLAFIFRGSLLMDHSIVEFTTKYRQVTVTNLATQKVEPFETGVDVAHRTVQQETAWW